MTTPASAAAYAAFVVSPEIATGRYPEDEITKTKKHHAGKGFDNPWPSWK